MAFDIPGAITTAANQYGVDPGLALSIAKNESGFNPAAVSSAGAVGPMQLMEGTAKGLGVDRHDVGQNIQGGVRYIRQLSDQFNGDPQLIAAAYNAGPGAVLKHGGVPPFPETRAYVAKVTGQSPDGPPIDQILKGAGFTADAAKAQASQEVARLGTQPSQAPSAPAASDEGPSIDQILKGAGYAAPAELTAAKPEPASMQAARADAAKSQDVKAMSGTVGNTVNQYAFGGAPLISGAMAAGNNALQHVLAPVSRLVGGTPEPAYGPGEAFQAQRDAVQGRIEAYQKAHPIANVAEMIGASTIGGPASAVEHAGESALAHVAPGMVNSAVGRFGLRAAGRAGVGAAYGGTTALSQNQSPADIAKSAAISAAVVPVIGAVGEGVGVAVPKVARGVVRPVLGAATGAGIGATAGALGLGDVKGNALTGAAIGALGGRGGRVETTVPAAADHAAALDLLAKTAAPTPEGSAPHTAAAETLQAAEPLHTTAEALGSSARPLLKAAGQGGDTAVAPVNDTLAARQAPEAKVDRIAEGIQTATGIDPTSAQMDVQQQIDAARKGPAKAAYDAALTGKPIWTPQLAELAKEPEVVTAMNQARRLLGSEAFVDNPEAAATPPPFERMSVADLKARMAKQGTISPGQEVSGNDLMVYLKSGGPSVYDLKPEAPPQVPTDRMWDMTKQMMDKNITKNALGKVDSSGENALRLDRLKQLRAAEEAANPEITQARAIGGEYLSGQKAYENGEALHAAGSGAETSAAFTKRFNALTPAEQQFTRNGYLAKLYAKMERGQNFSPESLSTPFHQSVQETMFGPDRAGQIQATLAREQALAASAKATQSSARGVAPVEDQGVNGTNGAMLGALESVAGGPHAMVHGAINGAIGGSAMKGVRGLTETLQNRKATPAVRHALGEILAQSPQATARQLRLRQSVRRSVPLSQSNLKASLANHALRGVALTGGISAAQAARDDGR